MPFSQRASPAAGRRPYLGATLAQVAHLHIEVSRIWVVWHVLEHELHYGGELLLTLDIHGFPAAFAI